MSESDNVAGAKNKESVWLKTKTPCLQKYKPAGTYYMRARIGGEPYREALGTTVYEVARRRLSDRLGELRRARGGGRDAPKTLWEAVGIVKLKIEIDPVLKKRTRSDYLEAITRLGPGGKNPLPTSDLSRVTQREMGIWWRGVCTTLGPQRANHLLMLVRRALLFARMNGSTVGDPTDELKRLPLKRTRLNLITLPQFRDLITSIRGQRMAWSRRSADSIEFQAYSGLRPAEMTAVLWEHVDEARQVIWVHGGEEGTKNNEVRPVPIIPEMRRLLDEMREGNDCAGRIFPYKSPPREALRSACLRLGFTHLRIYDLRHLFATTCNAAGVAVPMFAKWLGHRDGGALAMRTYVHPSDEHSRESAAKVKFA